MGPLKYKNPNPCDDESCRDVISYSFFVRPVIFFSELILKRTISADIWTIPAISPAVSMSNERKRDCWLLNMVWAIDHSLTQSPGDSHQMARAPPSKTAQNLRNASETRPLGPNQDQYPSGADRSSLSCKWSIEHTSTRVCVYFYGLATRIKEFLARYRRRGGSFGSAIFL